MLTYKTLHMKKLITKNQAVCFLQGSIISKKAAEQLDVLVLDVKFGIGAFMKERSEATRLAKQMVGMLLTLLLKIFQK